MPTLVHGDLRYPQIGVWSFFTSANQPHTAIRSSAPAALKAVRRRSMSSGSFTGASVSIPVVIGSVEGEGELPRWMTGWHDPVEAIGIRTVMKRRGRGSVSSRGLSQNDGACVYPRSSRSASTRCDAERSVVEGQLETRATEPDSDERPRAADRPEAGTTWGDARRTRRQAVADNHVRVVRSVFRSLTIVMVR